MNYQTSSSQNNFHSIITHEQLEQVIEAISDGRYSWACVLILRFIGYNPLHFIPQRTYSRLMKEHKEFAVPKANSTNQQPTVVNSSDSQAKAVNFNNSNYQTSDKKSGNMQGVNMQLYVKSNIAEIYPLEEKVLKN